MGAGASFPATMAAYDGSHTYVAHDDSTVTVTKEALLTDLPNPKDVSHKVLVMGYSLPKSVHAAGGTDKCKTAQRYDIIPMANGIRLNGISVDFMSYDPARPPALDALTAYDAVIVRINPGQIGQGGGSQMSFDKLMSSVVAAGKKVFSSPAVQTQLGAKDALTKIRDMNCGLLDTFTYYTKEELEKGMSASLSQQPRVLKQNRGSAGEGIWLIWAMKTADGAKATRNTFDGDFTSAGTCLRADKGDAVYDGNLEGNQILKCMEMNDNHVEYHTFEEFLAYCAGGKNAEGAGSWESTGNAPYLDPKEMIVDGVSTGDGQLVDQCFCPRIEEGEVRLQMVVGQLFKIIHKKPEGEGNLSAVGGNSKYTFFDPADPNLPVEYKKLKAAFETDIPAIMEAQSLGAEPLPLWWTGDFIPVDIYDADGNKTGEKFVVGEFNCSCVGLSQFNDA